MDYYSTPDNAALTMDNGLTACANSDTLVPVEIPHADALLSHISSLAYSHALQHLKCEGSEAARAEELEKALASLQNSFSLTEEQKAYLRHSFHAERNKKQSYIAERFSELEKNVVELAKARVKDAAPEQTSDTSAVKAISRLKDMLQLADEKIAEQIDRKANKLTENAFLIAVKDLALRRIQTDTELIPLEFEDIRQIALRFDDFELSPALLEKATLLYDRVLLSHADRS